MTDFIGEAVEGSMDCLLIYEAILDDIQGVKDV